MEVVPYGTRSCRPAVLVTWLGIIRIHLQGGQAAVGPLLVSAELSAGELELQQKVVDGLVDSVLPLSISIQTQLTE